MPADDDEYLNLAERLRALPQASSGTDAWPAVRHRLEVATARWRRQALVARLAAVASVAALGLFAGLKVLEQRTSAEASPTAAQVASAVAEDRIGSLRARSQALEELLAAMPARPAVERAGTSLPIETLETQVQWLDHQLSLAGPAGWAAPEAERLWHDRVEALNSLVQLRYVEAQRYML
jgi:hypothetical protein